MSADVVTAWAGLLLGLVGVGGLIAWVAGWLSRSTGGLR